MTQYSAAGCTPPDTLRAVGDVGEGCCEHDMMVTAPSAMATIGGINLGDLNDISFTPADRRHFCLVSSDACRYRKT